MTDEARKQLSQVNAVLAKQLPTDIAGMLIGRGLTLAQAEAVLERAKDLLRDAVI